MPVTLTDEDVRELRRLLHGLHRNPFEQGEIMGMGGLRSVLSRELLAKLCVQVPESKAAEMLYSPPAKPACGAARWDGLACTREPHDPEELHSATVLEPKRPPRTVTWTGNAMLRAIPKRQESP